MRVEGEHEKAASELAGIYDLPFVPLLSSHGWQQFFVLRPVVSNYDKYYGADV